MRIAIVSTPFVPGVPPSHGGIDLIVSELARELRQLGHEVTVFATGHSETGGDEVELERVSSSPDSYTDLLHCARAAEAISAGPFDVVHGHTPAMVALSRLLRAPVVHTLHHSRDRTLSRLYASVPSVQYVAISARQAELEDSRPRYVVHHGLSPDLYPLAGPGGESAYFLGRLAWSKGPDLAVAAARRAGMPIEIAGRVLGDDAPEGWAASVLAPALREPHVRCVGEASLAAKTEAFGRSRALLAPTRSEEPFGLMLVEAALAGCPVITFPRGAAPEIVEDGVTGFLVDDVRSMAAALRFAGKLDRQDIQARARKRFTAHRMAAEYLHIYRAAMESQRSKRERGAHVRAGALFEEDGRMSLAP